MYATWALSIFGGITAYVAFQQWRTSRAALKLALFEKRVAVYDAAWHAIAAALTGSFDESKRISYLEGTRQAQWLFGLELAHYLDDEVHSKLVDFICIEEERDNKDDPEVISKTARDRRVLLKHFNAQFAELRVRFSPYLDLGRVSNRASKENYSFRIKRRWKRYFDLPER